MPGRLIGAALSALVHFSAPAAPAHPGTAVYSISHHEVTLPSGERLEAHSGLGACFDTKACVSRRMVGSTPPHLYRLTERGMFYGTRALRLNPVGPGPMYGRAGLLTHPYLHGPKGETNGCIAFANFADFRRAYDRGSISYIQVTI